jgi:hypothetical protein
MTSEQKLLPCPFCGGVSTMEQTEDNRWSVGCSDALGAECMGYQSLTTFDRRGDAETAWNRRSSAALRASAEPSASVSGQYEFPYNRTFQAIAAATSVHAGGVGVNVSVDKFQEAFNGYPDTTPLTAESPAKPQGE